MLKVFGMHQQVQPVDLCHCLKLQEILETLHHTDMYLCIDMRIQMLDSYILDVL